MKKIVRWLNKHWTHPRDKIEKDFGIRATIHIPVGILAGLFLLDKDLLIEYELNEDAHSKDQAWKDMAGMLIGFPLGRAMAFTAIILILIWLIEEI